MKDLDLGRDLAAKVTDNAEWRAERPGQATISRAELIPFIRRILGDGGVIGGSVFFSRPVKRGGGTAKRWEGRDWAQRLPLAPSTMLRMVPLPRCAGEEK